MCRYGFGSFMVDTTDRRLRADGRDVAIGSRAIELLVVLLERRSGLLTKQELLERVWPGKDIGENNLATQVGALRRVLGTNAIVTVSGLGYRFGLPVDELPDSNLHNSVEDKGWVAEPSSATRTLFGDLEWWPEERQLKRRGVPLDLGARAYDLLSVLLAGRDRIVSKSELLQRAWPGLVVEEGNLYAQVSTLRRALGNDAIATVPGRGYRFVARCAAAPLQPFETTSPAPLRASPPRSKLPAVLPALIGRDAALHTVEALASAHRLVTITGAGGIGKTLLTQHLLKRREADFAHRVCWIDLSAWTGGMSLGATVAAGLGVTLADPDASAGLGAALAPLQLLLALDNAEHRLNEVAQWLAAALQRSPGLRVVVTSQAPLKLQEEWLFRLGPLALPATPLSARLSLKFGAIELFAQRARAADPDFLLDDDNIDAVVAICRGLDGSPLAIELAAARLPTLSPQEVLSALGHRLRLLNDGRRDAPGRQRTLRAAIEWSHGLLGETEQAVFRRMTVFVGAVDLGLTKEVLADERLDEWTIVDGLAGLVDRGLVSVSEGAVPRYRLLESPRAYALEMLARTGETTELRRRHAHAIARRWADRLLQRFRHGTHMVSRAEAIDAELEDARAAFAWAVQEDPDAAVPIGTLLLGALKSCGSAEPRAVAEALQACINGAQPAVTQGLAWRELAWWTLGRPGRHRPSEHAARSVAVLRTSRQAEYLYVALQVWASAMCVEGNPAAAQDALAELREIEDPTWPPYLLAFGANVETLVAAAVGDQELANAAARRHVALTRAGVDPASQALVNMDDTELVACHADAATRSGQTLVAMLRATCHSDPYAPSLDNLHGAVISIGDLRMARHGAREASPLARQFEMHQYWGDHMALLAAIERRHRTAARFAGYADECHQQSGLLRQVSK
jgi:predicted ATPase/DNA-binding winged helix-turn-helix (wHTH) protein